MYRWLQPHTSPLFLIIGYYFDLVSAQLKKISVKNLTDHLFLLPLVYYFDFVADWLGRALQKHLYQFDSDQSFQLSKTIRQLLGRGFDSPHLHHSQKGANRPL